MSGIMRMLVKVVIVLTMMVMAMLLFNHQVIQTKMAVSKTKTRSEQQLHVPPAVIVQTKMAVSKTKTRSEQKLQVPPAVIDCVTKKEYAKVSLDVSKMQLITHLKIAEPKWNETSEHRQEAFDTIYKDKIWFRYQDTGKLVKNKLGRLQGSGLGSTWDVTKEIRTTLDHVITYVKHVTKKSRISMLDAPCGDMVWMSKYLRGRHDVDYTGIDIVGSIITSHKEEFKHEQNWRFYHHDLAKKPLESSYDLIHSRQMLQHLTDLDTLQILQHFSSSGSLFLLASTYPNRNSNRDLRSLEGGRFRSQNLQLPPFSLHPPHCMHIDAGNPPQVCYSALWRLPLGQVSSKCRSKAAAIHKQWKYYYCA